MSELELIHYDAGFTYDPTRVYTPEDRHGCGKPVGLWVSVKGDDDWWWWCHDRAGDDDEPFEAESFAHAYRVHLAPGHNVLHIQSGQELEEFHTAYAAPTEFEDHMAEHFGHFGEEFLRLRWPIDWAKVALDCQGLIIAPYQWNHRLSMMWYYGWDCSSGCIWDLSAIKSVEEI